MIGSQASVDERCIGQDQQEFFAAITADHITAADVLFEQSGQLGQYIITGGMAKVIVDALEVIDVEHDGGQCSGTAPGPLELPVQKLHQITPVVESRQRIRDDLFVKQFQYLLQFVIAILQRLGHFVERCADQTQFSAVIRHSGSCIEVA